MIKMKKGFPKTKERIMRSQGEKNQRPMRALRKLVNERENLLAGTIEANIQPRGQKINSTSCLCMA